MFKKTFQQTISGSIWKFLLGSFGSGIALLLAGKNLWGLSMPNSILLGVVLVMLLFVLRFLFFLIINAANYLHNVYVDSIWGDAIILLKNAYSEIHYINRKDELSDRDFMTTMIIFCNILKDIFDKKTKANCCVSIKVPIADSDRLETLTMKNLCRDISHSNRDTQLYSDIEHTIIGNTPYVKIVNKLLRGGYRHLAYVNNDIEHTRDYENTSKPCYPNEAFPYKSELVYPIVPIKRDGNMTPKMLGFICIDCDKTNKFDEDRYDIPMVQGVVDGIYDLFVKRNN